MITVFTLLPLDKAGPPGNAWGLYGANDNLGALNMLTPDTVAQAAKEIRTGDRVSLDWYLNRPNQPSFDRPAFQWKRIVRKTPAGADRTVNDDYLAFNTQGSSQWDGFRHYGYQQAKQFYGGVTMDDLHAPGVIGIDAWVDKGGIVGRGVLIDYAGYCRARSIPTKPLESTDITVDDLEAVLQWQQGPAIQPGDILFLRSGFTAAYEALPATQQDALAARPEPDFIGLAPTARTLRWLWESEFAAVAGDAPSFERAPIAGAHTPVPAVGGEADPWLQMDGGGLIHQWVLAGWGVPIGELFDLETLAKKCAALGRYSFFVSSVPLKVPGGVASPPNAVAIF
ncbi:major facilitator superfamily [Ophiostoma piceae UAMH 11346]|uniref:Major facilitator superfamily n=1 Tax=Ophiostoma piceae (strain UAMH 11346) TaxID=1262450 RepID=S3BSY3_OPHP1|nr:major facilitator superfamily [Ophiostoma piceae UAMH 11346]